MRSSTSVALGVVTALLLTACGGGGGGENNITDPGDSPSVESISVEPSQATASAIDATAGFSATARDENGQVMSGVSFSWSSSNTSVASVSSSGTATAVGNGTTEITAEAEGVTGSATLTVDQEVASVEVSPTNPRLSPGESIDLSADPQDSNGHVVPDATVTWTSSNTSVATVDDQGTVTGDAEGTATISAESEGETGSVEVTVSTATSPYLENVSPTPIPEGGQVTIEGENFASANADNTVTIDGLEATVTSASSTELTVEVPLYNCLPARDVEIRVETSEGTGSITAGLTPDESPVNLPVGEGGITYDPEAFCFQFEDETADEEYLLMVQSASGVVGSLTPVTVTSETANGTGATSVTTQVLGAENRSLIRGAGRMPRDMPARWKAHWKTETEIRASERRLALSHPAVQPSGFPVGASVSGGVSVGDIVQVRVPDVSSSDPCNQYTEIDARVRAKGSSAIIVADEENPSGGFSDSDYSSFSDALDEDIWATQLRYFGQPSDADGNDYIVVVVTKELNRTSPGTLGFVHLLNLFPRSSCQASNEGEFFYAAAPDPNGVYGNVYPTDDARLDMPATMGHELTHVIQQTRRYLTGKTLMDSWLSEGQATFAEEVVAHELSGREAGQNYGATVAFEGTGPDGYPWYRRGFHDLLAYYGWVDQSTQIQDAPDQCGWWRRDPSPCDGRSLWYGVSWNFLRWVSDQLGPSYSGGIEALHQDLIDADADAWTTVETVTGESIRFLMGAWGASLYVDDRVTGAAPLLRQPSWDLFDIEDYVVSTAELHPFEAGFEDWQATGSIRSSSAGYVTVGGAGRAATAIRFRDSQGETLPSYMQVVVVRLR